ncbi:hypothetical protein WH87_07445 [Devosia epidermidihirudinis]|uniref:N-acetyltransferase domain-containing protein n=1 Tax=Devosia epidermidihirudinis TaxID=1293439 RepID=A0A0F5QFF2_9HYPH|nr:GNAT family N-acetyltransferase [Devosia epidermidihirudinis]KKC38744.1 hypothetical protein WH87_07445 [Devosia epidermidihirudinis]
MLRLVAATDVDFGAMAAGEAPDGLSLPAGGLEAVEVIEMLRFLAQVTRLKIDPAAWMIVYDGEVVGLCSITKPFSKPGMVEIGYGIAPERRGRGFATQAVQALIELLSSDRRIHVVTADTAVDNLSSQGVLEKNGFLQVGGRIDPADGAVISWQLAVR